MKRSSSCFDKFNKKSVSFLEWVMYLTFVKKALFYYTLFKERKGSG